MKKYLVYILLLTASIVVNAKFKDLSLNITTNKLKSDIKTLKPSIEKEHNLGPLKVTFFGGSKIKDNTKYSNAAHNLAKKLVLNKDATIITGGGSGIMKAGNCGAMLKNNKHTNSLGVTLSGIPSEALNECMQDRIHFDTFATRKIFLIHLADAFVFFPGGYGTLDELGEVLALIGTNKIDRVPIVLFGKEYWEPLKSWLEDQVFSRGLVGAKNRDLIYITDNINQAYNQIVD